MEGTIWGDQALDSTEAATYLGITRQNLWQNYKDWKVPLLREFVISQLERVEGFLIVGDGLAALRVVVPLLTCLHEDEGTVSLRCRCLGVSRNPAMTRAASARTASTLRSFTSPSDLRVGVLRMLT
jgi:hypothetical protein